MAGSVPLRRVAVASGAGLPGRSRQGRRGALDRRRVLAARKGTAAVAVVARRLPRGRLGHRGDAALSARRAAGGVVARAAAGEGKGVAGQGAAAKGRAAMASIAVPQLLEKKAGRPLGGIGFFGYLGFVVALAAASVAGLFVGARYLNLVPQYSESARARARR